LLEQALQDRKLRQAAFTAGIEREALLDEVRAIAPGLDRIGVDQRARIEEAELELADAKARYDRGRRFVARLRFLAGLEVGLLALVVVGLAFDLALSGRWTYLAVVCVVGALLMLGGVVLVWDWPPAPIRWRMTRRSWLVSDARHEISLAVRDLYSLLVESEVRRALRAYVNTKESDKNRVTLTLVEPEGLAELEDPRYAIPTHARAQLDGFLEDMPGGSIGISGPRGVGKTTLIRSVCPTTRGGTREKFGLVVSAPVRFDPREFLLYLFAETCRSVVGRRGTAALRKGPPLTGVVSGSSTRILARVAFLLAPLAGLAMIVSAVVPWPPLPLVAGGVLLILTAILLSRGGTAPSRLFPAREEFDAYYRSEETGLPAELVQQAADRLEDIWFQQTFTSGWSGKLKAPVAEAGLEGSRELARQQMTLPDIVGEFRRLLADLAEERQVLIGIDELDKIESRDAAHRFMNEIKVLFGIERCFFLVSVSEDAMSTFERRGLPFRDVFDSSFDDVVRAGFLDVDESVGLLQGRVIGMPLPFIYLCHCIAGGLARDVIRVAREVIVSNPEGQKGWPLAKACAAVVGADMQAKIEASFVATRGMALSPGVEVLRRWLQDLRDEPARPDGLIQVCAEAEDEMASLLCAGPVLPDDDPARAPRMLAHELLTFLLFSATLMEFFSPDQGPDDYVKAYEEGRLAKLAAARQALAVHPRVAWECLTDFRQGSETPRFPVPPRNVAPR
jgi:hypothetical protein